MFVFHCCTENLHKESFQNRIDQIPSKRTILFEWKMFKRFQLAEEYSSSSKYSK